MGLSQGFPIHSLCPPDVSEPTVEQEKGPLVALTPAGQGDAEFLYTLWDEEARSASFSGGPADLDTHLGWLKRTLSDPSTHLFVATERGIAVGSARLDVDAGRGREAVVSVSVAAAHRRKGIGTAILTALDGEARGLGLTTLLAKIKETNPGSRAAFAAAGYRIETIADGVVEMERTL